MTFRKFFRYVSLSALLVLPACLSGGRCTLSRTCTSTLPAGTSGGCCRSGSDPAGRCNSYLVCNSGVCAPCGGAGERCCGTNSCDSGLTCETDVGRCGDCGETGERCCASGSSVGTIEHVCSGAVSCNISTAMCEGSTTPDCATGLAVPVVCRLSHGCYTEILAVSRSCAEAVGCDIVDEALSPHNFCGESPLGVDATTTLWAEDDEEARECAEHTFVDYTFTDGCCAGEHCPFGSDEP